jgi:integrase
VALAGNRQGCWLVLQWFDPETGARKSKPAGTPDLKKAECKRTDLESDLNNGRYREATRLDWKAFRAAFESEYDGDQRASSREKRAAVLDVFEQVVRPDRLRAITTRTVSRFTAALRTRKQANGKVGLAAWTRRNYLVALRTALAWGVEQGYLDELPAFPKVRVPRKKPYPIAQQDYEKMLAKAPDELWRAFLLCAWWAGLWLSEAWKLQWERSEDFPWLDLPYNRIVLPASFAKSDEDQSVPLHPVLREALEKLPRTDPEVFPFRSRVTGKPLTRNGVTSRVIGIAEKAGVKLSMHRLRKGFGCRVAKQLGKGNAPVLHALMRHSSMQVTMDFYANVDDALQDVIRGLV